MPRSLTVAIGQFPDRRRLHDRARVAHGGHGRDRDASRDGAATGRGECVPYARYGETVEGVAAAIEALRAAIDAGLTREALQDAHAGRRRPQRARLRALGPRREALRRPRAR